MFTLPNLPYAYEALEPYIDTQTMHIHHDKHHAAYVKNLNDALAGESSYKDASIEEVLQNLGKLPEAIRIKVRNNGGGHYNHSLFWTVMSPNPTGETRLPSGRLLEEILKTYGDVVTFQEKFAAAGVGRFGSGWAWLSIGSGKLKIEDSVNQDNPLMEGRTPILGLDVWEHAYYLKYQNLRADYIKAWWHIVNWAEVEKRYTAAVGK